jgi:PAS domain S-box-containing protein
MASLRELDAELARGVIAAASDAIVVIDESGNVVFASPQAEALWGYKADELAGRPFDGLRERDAAGATADTRARFVGVRRDGTQFDADVQLSPIPTRHELLVALVVRHAAGTLDRKGAAGERGGEGEEPPGLGVHEGPLPSARGRVLIVDDDFAVARTLGRILGEEHACTLAAGGREAIQRIRAGERYDAILCDLSMPDAGGEEVHREVAAVSPDQARRMVFVSGGAFTPSSQAFLARVDNHRIDKPFDARSVREIVRAFVAMPARSS